MLLQGDLIPTLNIIATNQSDDVQTSVVIEGRADDPEISFRSSPDLPQEEVLARLLFDELGLDYLALWSAPKDGLTAPKQLQQLFSGEVFAKAASSSLMPSSTAWYLAVSTRTISP